ncbi:MAG: FliA/WhiG family RNA polymerase sigma factor [Myxococcota bacterium]|nr:FliA/WhiG family RNA polymerase sigma factor [Myxococcota bacterium]
MLQTRSMYAQNAYSRGERCVEGLTREEVTRHYQRKILLIARQLVDRLPPHTNMEFEDLVSYGAIGLLEAFDRFDDARGIQFSTFAEYRIRGAMLDALRGEDTFTRRRRQLAKRIASTTQTLRQELARDPSPGEVAECLGISIDDYWSELDRVKPVVQLSIDKAVVGEEDEGRTLLEQLAADPESQPGHRLDVAEVKNHLEEAVMALSEQQRHCVMMYYGKELSLAEIAEVYEVTPSRISQILSEARGRLRKKLMSKIDLNDLSLEMGT